MNYILIKYWYKINKRWKNDYSNNLQQYQNINCKFHVKSVLQTFPSVTELTN
jgi:hypothetical protein